jgi:CHAT domain-containing protein/tetratricopeptide (TPR) repeat protein
VIGVGSWVVIHRNQPAAADQLLARAYTEKRTLELRIAGAGYAPLRVSRGPAASFTSRPAALLKAEALIASQLELHPSDPSWLQAKAQADVLEGKYDAAVEALRRALELDPGSPDLLTDLATAYFQRAQQQEDRKEDFGAAYECLSQALKLHPDDPVALFNRAIVSEHQFLYQQALDDWEHYLRVDPGSQWVEEARNRADAVREKLKEHGSKATPLLSPAQVAAMATSASLGAEVDPRIEEYLHEAVRSWLPQAFPETRANADPHAAQALFFLADLTSQQHADRWLADLLRGSSAPHFPQAVTALARAVQANDGGEYGVSRQQADLAEQLFRASGNTAGVLRAQFEQTFAAQMERHSEECRRKAAPALTESQRYSYPWLQIQLDLEKGVCSGLMGDIGTDEKVTGRAMGRAHQSGYGALDLRAVFFAADDRLATGDQPGASAIASMGLERYWSGQFPARRGYSLYVGLAYIAEAASRPNLEVAIWREAVALIDPDEGLLFRAMAHNLMANAATAARLPQVAELQYADAARLFAAAPRTAASRNDVLETEIRTAELEAQQGRFDDAIARLTSIQDQVRPLSNNYLVQMFYSTLGEVQLRSHHAGEAEQALRPALALAEQSLATLRSSEAERTSWSKNAAPAYLALIEAELAQGRSQDALETYEWYLGAPQRVATDPRPYRTMTNPPMPDPSRLASRLPLLAKETVLAYAALPDGLAIWVYDDRGINARWIPKPTDGLQELAGRFHDLSSDPRAELSALRRDARSLYGSLIAPVEQHLAPGRTLVIEAEGWLARVPFEALLDSNGHYLVERVPMVHSLGQDSQARLRSDTGISADLPALVVASAASSPADGLIPLPDVATEADTVASGFHSARLLKGGEATLSAVRSELPGAAVFHFAGHSLATPERTGLMLEAGDGQANTTPRLMDASVVRQLHLQSLQLAVLSACSTASGSGGSSGFDSVTDALLRAGVPHVVASRWAVDSAETRRFVEDFYRSALSGQTASNATRLTSQKMLLNPSTAHPYYWAAFAAYGRP